MMAGERITSLLTLALTLWLGMSLAGCEKKEPASSAEQSQTTNPTDTPSQRQPQPTMATDSPDASPAKPPAIQPPQQPQQKPIPDDLYENHNTPDSVSRDLLRAILYCDKATVKKLTTPNPHRKILWDGERLPEDVLANQMRVIAGTTFRFLRPGEQLTLPGDRTVEITENDVNPKSQILLPNFGMREQPVLFIVTLEDSGRWKIDPEPLIATRLFAEAVRDRRQ